MHTEMMRLDRIRIGIPALVSATVVVVLLAAAVWLQPWNSGTDQFLWEIGADQSILPVGSVAHASGGEPVEAADATVGPDLDKNWCENADGHYHELGPVMSVKYGQPGSSDLTTNPSPGHSLQVMEIVCESEERTGRGSRGTIVWKSPDSPWYGR